MRPNKLVLVVLAVGVVLLLGAVIGIRRNSTPERVALPNPNGYADFQAAGTMVSEKSSDWHDLSSEALKALVATNGAALRLVQNGLVKGCQVPPYFLSGTNSAHLSELAGQKRIAQAFCAAFRLALVEGRTNDAVNAALDCCRFGQQATVGGVLIDALVGIAIQTLGLSCLRDPQLAVDAPTARLMAASLAELPAHEEPLAVVTARERRWMREGRFGSVGIIQQALAMVTNRQLGQKMRQKLQQRDAALRRAALDFAARAFELEHGQPPDSARELVPEYLRAVPLDPAGGGEMTLR